jgi:hypothetical protein
MEKENENKRQGKILLVWEFKEKSGERTSIWYAVIGILGGILFITAIFMANFLFAIFIILFLLVIFLQTAKGAETIKVKITDLGIELQNKFYPYHQINKFWIINKPPSVKVLYIYTQEKINPLKIIDIADEIDTVELRNILRKYLVEDIKKDDETFTDALGRALKL